MCVREDPTDIFPLSFSPVHKGMHRHSLTWQGAEVAPAGANAQPALPGKAIQEPPARVLLPRVPEAPAFYWPQTRDMGFILNPSVVPASLRAKFRQEAIRGLSGCQRRLAACLLNIKRQELGNV